MSPHGLQRAFQRGILREDIEYVINNPAETIFDPERKNYKSYGKVIEPYTKEERYLVVVHSKFNTIVNIYTVMWTNQGGLKYFGFRNI